jgi:hypothetical protein
MRKAGCDHTLCDRPADAKRVLHRRAQQRQLADQFTQN